MKENSAVELRALLSRGAAGQFGERRRIALHAAAHRLEAGEQAIGVAILAESRLIDVDDDAFAECVGERAFQPVADFDAHLALVGRDHDEQAVVLVGPAEAPLFEGLERRVLDAVALQAAGDEDGGPDAVLAAQLGDALAERRPFFG